MNRLTPEELANKHCATCKGDAPKLSPSQAERQLEALEGWRLSPDGQRIRKDWRVQDFLAAVDFFQRVAGLAEAEGHHPDFHLENYRHVWIELWTHALGGLSENDFILAAKIDCLPVEIKED